MSDLTKSNLQAFGAGAIGFFAVALLGGGALYLHASHQKKAGVRPAAAAIDLASSSELSRPAPSSPAARTAMEARNSSPAPMIGKDDAYGTAEAPATVPPTAADAPSPAAAPAAAGGSKLAVTQHLEASGAATTASAKVAAAAPAKDARAAKPDAKKAAPPLKHIDSDADKIASVHYGVTSRSELMGRAAGPVYNFSGGAAKGGNGMGKLAGDVDAQVAAIKKQLESTTLTPDERASLQKSLDGLTTASDAAKKTAQ